MSSTPFKITKYGIVGNLTGSVQGTASYAITASYVEGGNESSPFISGTGSGSVVLSGSSATASGQYSHAEGSKSLASGTSSHAEGYRTVASGQYSHAEGRNTAASGQYSHAEGFGAVASGQYSHAEGNLTRASGGSSHAEGESTIASGSYSHAEGSNTISSGLFSHAEGYRTTASNDYEHAQGKYNVTASSQIFSIGCGDSVSTRKNAVSIITGSGTVPSASIYVYGIGGYDGTNPEPGVNDVVTVINKLIISVSALRS